MYSFFYNKTIFWINIIFIVIVLILFKLLDINNILEGIMFFAFILVLFIFLVFIEGAQIILSFFAGPKKQTGNLNSNRSRNNMR